MRNAAVPAPHIPGIRIAGPEAARTLHAWATAGHAHGARVNTGWTKAVDTYLHAVDRAVPALLIAAARRRLANPANRYYATDTAMLALNVRDDHWSLSDHVTQQPRARQGKPLRDAVMPAILATARDHHLTITLTASSEAVADLYKAENDAHRKVDPTLPTLHTLGRAYPRGVRMAYKPTSSTEEPDQGTGVPVDGPSF